MSRILRGLLALVAVAGFATGVSRAETLPAGSFLLQQTQAAMKVAPSYHLQGVVDVGVAGQTAEQVTMRGDFANSPRLGHIIMITPTAFGSMTVEEILVGNRMALRIWGSPWRCRQSSSLQQLVESVVGTPQIGGAQTLGAGVLSGTPVWRVQAVTAMQLLGRTQYVHLTFYTARSDHRLLLEEAQVNLRINNAVLHERIRMAFSRFGETVKASLPAASCR